MMNQWRGVSCMCHFFFTSRSEGNERRSLTTVWRVTGRHFDPIESTHMDITSITRESCTLFVQRAGEKETAAFFATINCAISNHVYDDGGTAGIIRQWQKMRERLRNALHSVQRPLQVFLCFSTSWIFSWTTDPSFSLYAYVVYYYSRPANKHF